MARRIITIVALFLVLNLLVAGLFYVANNRLKQKHAREVVLMQSRFSSEDKKREKTQAEEINKIYGETEVERALNDPHSTILDTLKTLARAFAPKNSETAVSVDNFTEFSIIVSAVDIPEPETQAQFIKNVLSRIEPKYVFEIVFVDLDGKKKIIEQPKLLRVKDYAQANLNTIIKTCL